MKAKRLEDLMQNIHYQFVNIHLLEMALSHRSCGRKNNERLEFLGDSIVNFVIASELFKSFPKAREGHLSRLRASLVKGETLAEIAKEFDVGSALLLGPGELKSGGTQRVSILADALEAIIGSIYLDSSLEVCYEVISGWFQTRIESLSLDDVHKDPKSRLQELLQSKQLPLPEYKLTAVTGEEHNQEFTVECMNALLMQPVVAQGTSRRRAEQKAAELVLQELQHER